MKTEHAILLAAGVLSLDFIITRLNKSPNIFINEKLPFNYNASTVPPFGIVIQREDVDNEMLIEHELIHWDQYRKHGSIIYYLKYLIQKSIYGYDKMPMEIEARIQSGENARCIENYTQCVRTGEADTIFDPNFRVNNLV